MRKRICTIKDLEQYNHIVCYGTGGSFYSFLGMPYAAKILSAVKFCVDRNCNRTVCVSGKNIPVKSPTNFVDEIQAGDLILITSADYSAQIEEYLGGIAALDNTACASLKDLYYKWNDNGNLSGIIARNATRPPIIPKTIHWCWFGGNPLSKREMKCIESWGKYCSEYKIVKWDEENFDVNICDYVREAHKLKEWAFISDFFRLWVLYHHGGIYLDSDVEVTNNLDPFLCHNAFSGFEDNIRIPTGIMGSERHSTYMKYLLDYYNNRHFIHDGVADMTTNVATISRMTYERYQYDCSGHYFEIGGEFAMYPREVFCPINEQDRMLHKTGNTYAIHHFAGSWISSSMPSTTSMANSTEEVDS